MATRQQLKADMLRKLETIKTQAIQAIDNLSGDHEMSVTDQLESIFVNLTGDEPRMATAKHDDGTESHFVRCSGFYNDFADGYGGLINTMHRRLHLRDKDINESDNPKFNSTIELRATKGTDLPADVIPGLLSLVPQAVDCSEGGYVLKYFVKYDSQAQQDLVKDYLQKLYHNDTLQYASW
jgi:hypothetical protein